MSAPAKPDEAATATVESLPEWARAAFASVAAETKIVAKEDATSFKGRPEWPDFVEAALVSTFLPRQLSAGSAASAGSPASARAVLDFAERVNTANGMRWALTRDARRAVLVAADEGDIRAALERTPDADDPVSKALRAQLRGQIAPASLSLRELEAERTAASWLLDRQPAAQTRLDGLDRRIAMLRLLRPFYHMLGVDDLSPANREAAKTRLFGRAAALGKLYDYVGIERSGNLVAQIAVGVVRSLSRPAPPMVIFGRGGVGKTTLVAKFVLDHADNAYAHYPFAYLDFDRGPISARRPAHLLDEICAQVITQFPELTSQLTPIRERARDLGARLDQSAKLAEQELATFMEIGPLLDAFREAVDLHTANLEGSLELKRPFLLVLDTFEVVQNSELSVACMERFIQRLAPSRENDGRGWARLRLVISGRKRPDRFLAGFDQIELGSLEWDGACAMLQTLTREAGRPIDLETVQRLLAAVTNVGKANTAILSPLRIRMIADVLTEESAAAPDGEAAARQLADQLEKAREAGQGIGSPAADDAGLGAKLEAKLVEGILVRRILGHIADDRVKALADPGLVVRFISPDVICEVMAKGTPAPGATAEVRDGDSLNFTPWTLTPTEADEIFSAFQNEKRLIEPDLGRLRHRQDVREDMLPLIEVRRPNRFAKLHRLAADFYGKRLAITPEDASARAEAIYHGLWCGDRLEDIDALWNQAVSFDPKIARSEFDERPVARRYLLAKEGLPLGEADLRSLPQAIASEWVAARGEGWLQDDKPNAAVDLIRAATGEDYEGLRDRAGTTTIVARLLYRTGAWADCALLIERSLGDPAASESPLPDRSIGLLRIWAHMAAKLGVDPEVLSLAQSTGRRGRTALIARIELLSYALLGQYMARSPSSLTSASRRLELAGFVRSLALDVSPTLWRNNQGVLRCAILASDGDIAELLAIYLNFGGVSTLDTSSLPLAAEALSLTYALSGEEATGQQLAEMATQVASSPDVAPGLRSLWQDGRSRLIRILRQSKGANRGTDALQRLLRRLVVFDHLDWSEPLGQALTRWFDGDSGTALRNALRHEDFVADAGSRNSAFDGPSIVLWATARGNLLRLVEVIEQFSDVHSNSQISVPDDRYPATVFGIAEAMLLWHDVLLQAMSGGGDDDPHDASADPAPEDSGLVSRVFRSLTGKRAPPRRKRSALRTRRKK